MKKVSSARPYFPLLLFATAAAAVLSFATKNGIGLTPDSGSYIGAARSILAGQGISVPCTGYSDPRDSAPLTGFPPLYPIVLAAFGLTGPDPIIGARVVAILLFSTNVLLIGAIIYRHTRSVSLSALGSLLALLSIDMLAAHYSALSEPLYVFLLLLIIGFLYEYLGDNGTGRGYLIICSISAGLLLVTRYSGILFIPGVMISLLALGRPSLRRKIEDFAVFSAIAFLPYLILLIRNRSLAEPTMGRGIAFNLRGGLEDVQLGFQTIGQWLIPDDLDPEGISGLAIVVLLGLLWLILTTKAFRGQTQGSNKRQKIFLLITWPIAFFYLASVFIIDSFITWIRLDSRILLPAYVLTILFALVAGHQLLRLMPASSVWHKRRLLNAAVLMMIIGLLTVYTYRAILFTRRASEDGFSYSEKKWRNSELIAFLRDFPAQQRAIYSNGYDAIYLHTGKPAKSIKAPSMIDENAWIHLSKTMKENNGLFVYFNPAHMRIHTRIFPLPSEEELLKKFSLQLVLETPEGKIYETIQ